jgi:hypothetical protein
MPDILTSPGLTTSSATPALSAYSDGKTDKIRRGDRIALQHAGRGRSTLMPASPNTLRRH